MRTKALVCAAAVIAAGLATSQSQVFSVNIVGYVNTVLKGSNSFNLIANPLDDGTNTANSVLAALPNKTQVQTWNGAGYDLTTKSGGAFLPNPSLPPGKGFFVKLSTSPTQANLTNTFVGNVAIATGTTNSSNLPGGTLSLVGSVLPVGGALNDTGPNTLNINATLPNKTQIQTFDNSGAGGFVLATKSGGAFLPNSAVIVGQGFFVKPNSATNWTQTLQ